MQHKQQVLSVSVPTLIAPPAATVAPTVANRQDFIEAALQRPTPRRVRLSRETRIMRILLVNVTLALFAFAYALGRRSGNHIALGLSADLLKYGACAALFLVYSMCQWTRRARFLQSAVAVMGKIIAISPKADWRLDSVKITYRFETLDSAERTQQMSFPSAFAAQYSPGQTLTILYNPAHPDQSYPYSAIKDVVLE